MKVYITDYEKQKENIHSIRKSVFVIEQKVPAELEFDDQDPHCTHAIVFDDQTPIAVGRIDLSKDGKVGRVAVLKEYRRRGAGSLVIQALEQFARKHQQKTIWFHAQISSIPFYSELGYQVVGEEFLEASIVHQKMEKQLPAQ